MKALIPLNIALGGILAVQANAAVTAVSSITSSGTSTTHDVLETATVGTTLYSSSQIIQVASAVSENTRADYDIAWKSSAPKPDDSTLSALSDASFTTGLLNPGNSGPAGFLNFTLSSPATVGVILFEHNAAATENFSLRAFDGSGTLIGNAVAFQAATSAFGAVTADINFSRDSGTGFTQRIFGAFVPIADFGVGSAAGFRLTSPDGDPTLLVGVVPEPASALLAAAGACGMFLRRRR